MIMANTKNPVPDGYSTVCPYLMVESVEKTLEFMKQVFNATIREQLKDSDGFITHGEAKIGDTVIMIGKARKEWPAYASSLYVFVADADKVYRQGLQSGAISVMEPGDRFYGLREGGIKDTQGNVWWLAQEIEKVSPEEMQRRMNAAKQGS
jgi:PhnB protein